MRPALPALLMAVPACALLAACTPARQPHAASAPWEVAAVRFATIPGFRVRGLVSGADTARRLDIAMMVWPLRARDGSIVLVDAGFTRRKFIDQWKPADYVTPDSALRLAGYDPTRVTDIIVSHIHWDHADGVDRFPQARVWLQRDEFEYYVGPNGEARHPAIDTEVAAMYRRLMTAGRVQLLAGDSAEVKPGLRVYTGGRHTWASQYVGVATAGGTVVIASDNAYLYENLSDRRPIAQTLDSSSNLAAQARMQRLASRPGLVVPGHDPEVFTRFGAAGARVARIR